MDTTITFENQLQKDNVPYQVRSVETLQVNIGKLCNQACRHCHVESGPGKVRENMDFKSVQKLLSLIDNSKSIKTVDITGGAPELNPNFRLFVSEIRKRNIEVLDRCNLTVFAEPGQKDTPEFLAANKINVVASLPCYSKDNVDQQRGNGVFKKSIDALIKLNELGYAKDPDLKLDLVYNPQGASLPPAQEKLQADYKIELKELFGIEFNNLFTITNMPIKRFLTDLNKQGKYQEYMQLLVDNFNPGAAENIMCRDLVSISWDGKIFDCDFNQMLNIPIDVKSKTIFDIESFDNLIDRKIKFENHCFGCTAGAGSSCTGSLA